MSSFINAVESEFITRFIPLRRTECRPDQFKCNSGQCIESAQRCDRIVDCPDRSDENSCGKTTRNSIANCVYLYFAPLGIQCQSGEFSCSSGNQCVPYSLVCDGRKDCQDFSDEANCRKFFQLFFSRWLQKQFKFPNTKYENKTKKVWTKCPAGEFACENGPCIPMEKRCDGHVDCPESSDEFDCRKFPLRPMPMRHVRFSLLSCPSVYCNSINTRHQQTLLERDVSP